MGDELERERQMEKEGRQRKGTKWDRERGVRDVHSPTPRFWRRSQRPEAKIGALS